MILSELEIGCIWKAHPCEDSGRQVFIVSGLIDVVQAPPSGHIEYEDRPKLQAPIDNVFQQLFQSGAVL